MAKKSEKLKIDPITQSKQALQFFKNLKEAVAHLDKLVEFNIKDIEKTIQRLEKQEQALFDDESPAQTKSL